MFTLCSLASVPLKTGGSSQAMHKAGLTPAPPQLKVGRVFLPLRFSCAPINLNEGAIYLTTLANVTKDDAGFPPAPCTHRL